MIVTALLCGQVVLLTVQNRSLRVRLAEIITESLPDGALAVGDYLDPIRLLGQVDSDDSISFVGQQKSLVLFFSEDCPACQRTLPIWDELLPGFLSSEVVRIVAINLDHEGNGEPPQHTFPVFGIDPRDRSSVSGQVPVVPATVLIGMDGVVDRVWFGVPRAEDVDELTDLLKSEQAG